MPKQSRRKFLAQVPVALSIFGSRPEPLVPSQWTLWYKQPAKIWTDALPLGNGRLGTMVFGGINEERLQLNADTLWSGYPHDWNNPHASEALPEVRRLVLQQKNYHAADGVCHRMQGPFNESYQPLGNLHLKFEGDAQATDYRRELDLDTAVAQVTFNAAGVTYTREAFCSAPDQVMFLRLSASKRSALNFTLTLDSPLRSTTEASGKNQLRLYGKAPAHVEPNYVAAQDPVLYDEAEGKGMRFECRLEVHTKGGKMEPANGGLRITTASEVIILLAAGTGYRGFDRMPDRGAEEISQACIDRLTAAGKSPLGNCAPTTLKITKPYSAGSRLIWGNRTMRRLPPTNVSRNSQPMKRTSTSWRSIFSMAAIC